MRPILMRSIASEWLKLRGSLAGWLVAGAGLFLPTILVLARIKNPNGVPAALRNLPFWEAVWNQSWEAATVMILPIGAVLIVSVVTQVEFRANGWKQVEATPQSLLTIFLAKLTVIVALLLLLLAWFNLGTLAVGYLPGLIVATGPRPTGPLPLGLFVERNVALFVDTLPVIAIQFLISLRARSFLTPLGFGMAAWFVSIGMLSWQHNYLLAYAYAAVEYLPMIDPRVLHRPPVSIQLMALAIFVTGSVGGYVLYRTKTDRG